MSETAPANALYTPAQRARRDASPWTLVQGILAPIQFLVFAVSVVLVLRYLASGEGLAVVTASVVIKTLLLYTIMVTGCVWESQARHIGEVAAQREHHVHFDADALDQTRRQDVGVVQHRRDPGRLRAGHGGA